MKVRLLLACFASMSALCLASCGSKSTPTTPTAPVDPVDYVISGAAESVDTPFSVDDEVRLYVSGQSVGTWPYSGVARFRGRPGDILTVQAVDTCQGLYRVSALWIHRGQTAQQITAGVATCSLSSVPCLSPSDCGAPDRIFLQLTYTLP
jgi:hypothetical protein